MATKVIKLKENNNTLIPVTDAKIVQMTYDGTTYSVHDVILDTEEAIATTYNHLSSRIENLEYYVDNPPLLNTDNSNSLTPMSAEEIDGTINLHKVSKTGSWDDLNDKPTIPPAPIKSNWNETNSSSLAYILNKPTIPAAPGTLNTKSLSPQSVSSSESLSGNINLHRISKTGNYNDLINAPNAPVTLKNDEDVYASIDNEFDKENGAVFLSYVNDPLNSTDVDNFILSKVDYTQSPLLTYFSNISPDGTINIISIDESDNKEKFSLPLFYILDDTDSATLYNIIDGSNNAAQASRNLLGEHVYNALDNNKTVKWKYNIGSNEYTLIFDFENNAENQHFEMFASRQGILIKVEGTKSSSNWTITVTKTSFAVATQLKTVNSTSLVGTGNIDADDVIMGKLNGTAFYKVTGYSGIQSTPSFSETAETGNADKVYVDIQTNKAYRWKNGVLMGAENPYKLLSEELSVITTSDISAVLPGKVKKAVSAKVLRDNFYTETEVDTALARKQDIDDVYVDQAYVDTNTTNSFASNNKRYNIACQW